MQRILVKEHVLDALSIIEKKSRGMLPENQKRVRGSSEILKDVSSSESEQSFEESEEEEEEEIPVTSSISPEKRLKTEDDLLFEDDEGEAVQLQSKEVENVLKAAQNDEDLLLDNYYKKVTDFFTEQPTTSSSDSQGERVSIKTMRENFEKKR